MKIISLKTSNIKNIKAIEINPDGTVVQLTGPNGAGKSAVLDSILSAITGKRLEDAVRHGEEKAEVVIDLGEMSVRKRWTAKGEYLEVFSKDGDKKQSPQTFLDKVVGRLSFDPLAFKGMKPSEQLNQLKAIVSLDFSDIELEQKKVYDERTGVNSKIKDAIAQLKNIEAPDPKTPDDEIRFGDALADLNQLRDKKKACDSAYQEQLKIEGEIEDVKSSIDIKFSQICKLQDEIKALKESGSDLETQLAGLVHPPNVTDNQIREAELALQDIERKNVLIRAAKRYRQLTKNAEKLKQESDGLDERITRLEQDKSTRIGAAKMPIDGLSISDADVIFNGIPFSRLSTGQQIRISTAIAMKLNPSLKVILIRDGSLLDAEGKTEVFSLAKENDFQVWVESVDETGDIGFFIENGEISKVEGVDARPVEAVVA